MPIQKERWPIFYQSKDHFNVMCLGLFIHFLAFLFTCYENSYVRFCSVGECSCSVDSGSQSVCWRLSLLTWDCTPGRDTYCSEQSEKISFPGKTVLIPCDGENRPKGIPFLFECITGTVSEIELRFGSNGSPTMFACHIHTGVQVIPVADATLPAQVSHAAEWFDC